jgi:hypothetical protein
MPIDTKALFTLLLDLEAQDSRIDEPAFKLGYLLSFVSSQVEAGRDVIVEATARIRHLQTKLNAQEVAA